MMSHRLPQFIIIWILTGIPLVLGILVLVTPNTKTTQCVKYMKGPECSIWCVPINKTVAVDCRRIETIDSLYYNYFRPENYGFTCLGSLVIGIVFVPLSMLVNMIASLVVCCCCPTTSPPTSQPPLHHIPIPPVIPEFFTEESSGVLGIQENSPNIIIVVNPKN